MPELTRRRYPERQDCWHVYFGDVHVGTIARRVGQPHDEDPWEWQCGFYPGSDPGEQYGGTAATFDRARDGFERDWRLFSAKRTEAMWERGERMPSQKTNSLMRCACGETFDSHRLAHTLIHVPHITLAQRADGIGR